MPLLSLNTSSRQHLMSEKANVSMHCTDNQAKLTQCYNTLQCHINSWVQPQHLFMHTLAAECLKHMRDSKVINSPELYQLMLPSQIGKSISCDTKLYQIEWKLWYAQAHDILYTICSNLQTWSYLLRFKDCHLQGQGANTWACNTLKTIEASIEATTSQYSDAHKTLVDLMPILKETGWTVILHPLYHQDICAMLNWLEGKSKGQISYYEYGTCRVLQMMILTLKGLWKASDYHILFSCSLSDLTITRHVD